MCVVIDRGTFVRGRWDGRRFVDIAVYVGGIGIHIFWPGLGQSNFNYQRRY